MVYATAGFDEGPSLGRRRRRSYAGASVRRRRSSGVAVVDSRTPTVTFPDADGSTAAVVDRALRWYDERRRM